MSTIKFIFSSLFSNDTVINESKKKPWWLSIIIALIACVVAIIPSVTNVLSYNGSDIIKQQENHNLDYSLKTFTYEYLRKTETSDPVISMYIDQNGLLNCDYNQTVEIKYNDDVTLLFAYVNDADKLTTKINELKTSYPIENENKSSIKNMLLFTRENVYLYIYSKDATCTYTQSNEYRDVTSSSDPIYTMSGAFKDIDDSLRNFNAYYDDKLSVSEAQKQSLTKWTSFLDESYEVVKNSAALTSAGVFFILDLGVILIMSLTVFILSRTKSSIRKFNYIEALKMVLFATLSPGLLSMLLGFMIPSMQSMSFVLFLGLRITWLGMKATSPQETNAVRK